MVGLRFTFLSLPERAACVATHGKACMLAAEKVIRFLYFVLIRRSDFFLVERQAGLRGQVQPERTAVILVRVPIYGSFLMSEVEVLLNENSLPCPPPSVSSSL